MTDEQARISKLEDKYHGVDKRQESFESFMRSYIDSNEKNIAEMKADMRDIKSQIQHLSSQFNNLLIAGGVGVLTIIVTILASK